MKKNFFTLAFAAIILISSAASATERPVWRKKDNFHYALYVERYVIDFDNIYCAVNINVDGDLEIYATDANFYGKTASQYLKIKDGNVIEDKTSVTDYREMLRSKEMFRSKMGGGYSVFVINVSPHVPSLPKHVREKFKGTCDVE